MKARGGIGQELFSLSIWPKTLVAGMCLFPTCDERQYNYHKD